MKCPSWLDHEAEGAWVQCLPWSRLCPGQLPPAVPTSLWPGSTRLLQPARAVTRLSAFSQWSCLRLWLPLSLLHVMA